MKKRDKPALTEEQQRLVDALPPGLQRTMLEGALRKHTEIEETLRQLLALVDEAGARKMADSYGPDDPAMPGKVMAWWHEEQAKKGGR